MLRRVWRNATKRAGRRAARFVFCCALAAMAAGCGDGMATRDFDAPETNASVKRGVPPQPDSEAAVVETDFGPIVIELYPNIAPQMVERFKRLAREGFYNGTTFHRAEPYVIQGGDPNSRDDDPSNDGGGGSSYPDVPPEPSDVPYEPGTVGAADAGLGTANSQFFIALRRMPQWEGRYTAFGRVVKGLDNARVISGAPKRVGSATVPDPKIIIKSVTLQPRQNF